MFHYVTVIMNILNQNCYFEFEWNLTDCIFIIFRNPDLKKT